MQMFTDGWIKVLKNHLKHQKSSNNNMQCLGNRWLVGGDLNLNLLIKQRLKAPLFSLIDRLLV